MALCEPPGSHSIAVVDVSKLKVIAEWPIPYAGENFALALDSEKRRIFVVCRRPSRLVVLNMDSGKVVVHATRDEDPVRRFTGRHAMRLLPVLLPLTETLENRDGSPGRWLVVGKVGALWRRCRSRVSWGMC